MIASLESEFDLKLIYRSRSGVYLTPEGKELYPFIQSTLNVYQHMSEKVDDLKHLNSGIIRIGTISSISAHWLPNLINTFQKQYPNVKFILHQGDYDTIPEWIRTKQIDFGFVNPDALPKHKVHLIKTGVLKAVVPIDHRLANKKFVTLQELSQEPFLELEEGSFSEPLTAFENANLKPKVKMRIHDDYSILSMIESGMGVSILPELVLQKTAYKIAIIPIQPALSRKIGIIEQDSKTLPIASKRFIDLILKSIEILP